MSQGTDRLMNCVRQKLNGCSVVKEKKLMYRRGGKKEFDHIVEKLTSILDVAKQMNGRAVPPDQMYEGPALHPDCVGTYDHQNQESMYYCPKCTGLARKQNKKARREKKRLIYRV